MWVLIVAFALSFLTNVAVLCVWRRRPRCPEIHTQTEQRCRYRSGHHGPHYTVWDPPGHLGTIWRHEIHWHAPEPDTELLEIARTLSAFDRELSRSRKRVS